VEAAVVLVDCSRCREMEVLRTLLVEALDVPVVRVGGDDLLSLGASLDLETGIVALGRRRIRPTAVWVRNTSSQSVSVDDPGGSRRRRFFVDSWSLFLNQLIAVATVAIPGREPGRIEQVIDAFRLGVRVPRTEVTTDVREAVSGWDCAKVVVKPLGPHFPTPRPIPADAHFAEVVDRRGTLPSWVEPGSPVVVQEYVEHVRELRVYYVDGAVGAIEVSKPTPASLWTEPDRTRACRVECPPNVRHAVQALAEAWDLRYGAFDLLVTSDGRPVFLEVNTDGDWLWFERKAGWNGVTFMAATMLRDLHERVARRALVP